MTTALIARLKELKHQSLIARKRLRRAPDEVAATISDLVPYKFDELAYRADSEGHDFHRHTSVTFKVNHLLFPARRHRAPTRPIPFVMYCFWTGPNRLSRPRQRALESLKRVNPEIEVRLVTPQNLSEYLVQGHPLHPAYEDLSYVHRSDYLRAYFMHHHGGVYCDLKEMHQPWAPLLRQANADPSIWACGPCEPNSRSSDPALGRLGLEQRLHHRQLLFQAAFAFRPYSAWTEMWLAEVERRLNYSEPLLRHAPAEQPFGYNKDYPVPWYALLSQVLAPLSLKYSRHSLIDPSMHFTYRPGGHR